MRALPRAGLRATSIADITTRAGVSRSSFFNYFASKSDILWAGLDERIASMEDRLRRRGVGCRAAVRSALTALADEFAPDSLALALVNARAMGLEAEFEREASVRRSRIARAVAARLRVGGSGLGGRRGRRAAWRRVLAAVEAWAHDGAGRTPLAGPLEAALRVAGRTLPG